MKWIKLSLIVMLVLCTVGCVLTVGWQRYTQKMIPR